MPIKKELSIVLPNKPGKLAAITSTLSRAKVNLLAVDVSGGFEYSTVRLLPENVAHAKSILRKQKIEASESTVLCVNVKDEMGALARVAGVLGRAKINIDYIYVTTGRNGGEAMLVIHASDIKKAARLLE
jgi:hypothetical protein